MMPVICVNTIGGNGEEYRGIDETKLAFEWMF